MSRAEGIDERKVADLAAFEESAEFSELEKRVLRYSAAMTRTPADVPRELFDGLREHFDPPQLVELATAIAWENFRARMNRGFGIEAEGFTDGACPVHFATAHSRSENSPAH